MPTAIVHPTIRRISNKLRAEVRQFIRTDLAEEGVERQHRVKHWTDAEHIELAASMATRADFPIMTFRSRIQILLIIAILVETCTRPGTILTHADRPDSRNLRWEDAILRIVAGTDGLNVLSIHFRVPNGKTDQTRRTYIDISQQHRLWIDGVFLFLVLAQIAGAFPVGWTFAQLLDPTVLEGAKTLDISFNPAFAKQDVFISFRDVRHQSGAIASWSVGSIERLLAKLNDHANLNATIGVYTIRRTGGIPMHSAGMSFCHPT
jgi:hypothetical protein